MLNRRAKIGQRSGKKENGRLGTGRIVSAGGRVGDRNEPVHYYNLRQTEMLNLRAKDRATIGQRSGKHQAKIEQKSDASGNNQAKI